MTRQRLTLLETERARSAEALPLDASWSTGDGSFDARIHASIMDGMRAKQEAARLRRELGRDIGPVASMWPAIVERPRFEDSPDSEALGLFGKLELYLRAESGDEATANWREFAVSVARHSARLVGRDDHAAARQLEELLAPWQTTYEELDAEDKEAEIRRDSMMSAEEEIK